MNRPDSNSGADHAPAVAHRALSLDLRSSRESIAPFAAIDPESVEELWLFVSRDSDLSGLEEFRNLRTLFIDRSVEVPDGAVFPKLEHYDGPFVPSILRSPNLRELICTEARTSMQADLHVVGPVERMLANGDRADGALPSLAHPELLVDFDVAFFNSLNLDGLERCRNLSELRFHSIKRVDRVDRIAELPSVRLLSFSDVLRLTPSRAHDRLTADTGVGISGRHGFSPTERAKLTALNHGWGFPPSARCFVPHDGVE